MIEQSTERQVEGPAPEDPGSPREAGGRGSRLWPLLFLLFGVVLLALGVLMTTVKAHETFVLPGAPMAWNRMELSKIDRNTNDFVFEVFADNKNSNRTFNLIMDRMAMDRPLFGIDIGDLVIDGNEIMFRLFLRQIESLPFPVLTAVGNHDIDRGGPAIYRRLFGEPYYSFTVGRSYFIVLDDANEVRVDEGQMKWFEAQLIESQEYEHCFVFLHVPPFKGMRNPEMPMKEFLADRKNARKIKQLCVRSMVTCVFTSHVHTYDFDVWPWDIRYIMTGGGGAPLWDVDRYRDLDHYVKVTVKGRRVYTEMKPVFTRASDVRYRYFDQPWTYTYVFIAEHYWLLAPPVFAASLAFILVFALAVRKKRRTSAAR